jgi:hypothetical protein
MTMTLNNKKVIEKHFRMVIQNRLKAFKYDVIHEADYHDDIHEIYLTLKGLGYSNDEARDFIMDTEDSVSKH